MGDKYTTSLRLEKYWPARLAQQKIK